MVRDLCGHFIDRLLHGRRQPLPGVEIDRRAGYGIDAHATTIRHIRGELVQADRDAGEEGRRREAIDDLALECHHSIAEAHRSEERRVGKACVSTVRPWWPPTYYKKKKKKAQKKN